MGAAGYKTQVKELADYYDAYNLEGDIAKDMEEEEEEEEEEGSDSGSEDDSDSD